MISTATYSEATEEPQLKKVQFSHLSIETGHFFMREFEPRRDPATHIRNQFRRVARLTELYRTVARDEFSKFPADHPDHGSDVRISTCFLFDDYFGSETSPRDIIPMVLDIAVECGLSIDYLAREAGCVDVRDGESTLGLAEMVRSWIVEEPEAKSTTGSRPPLEDSGWLCNGRRSSEHDVVQAMRARTYRPPVEYGAREHSIFSDVQLWSPKTTADGEPGIHWSCPFLAAVWQLLRLGMIRYQGRVVGVPQPRDEHLGWPDSWASMPTVTKLNKTAPPFAAYRALSILPPRYLKIENAVQLILDHTVLDNRLVDLTRGQAAKDGVALPDDVGKRLSHYFLDDVAAPRPAR